MIYLIIYYNRDTNEILNHTGGNEMMHILETKLFTDGNNMIKLEVYLKESYKEMDKIPMNTILEEDGVQYLYGQIGDFVGYSMYDEANDKYWSSRASVFNGMFGKRCMEATLITSDGYRLASAVTVDMALMFLPDGFYIIEQTEEDADGNKEISYSISNHEHEESSFWFKDIVRKDCYKKVTARLTNGGAML